jgi:GntR family transcriptional regulator
LKAKSKNEQALVKGRGQIPLLIKGAIDKASPLPAYAQLADFLRAGISRGEYPPGSRLPAEATLAKAYGVSAMTARQAVSVLEEENLVRRVQGSGTYVRKVEVGASNFGLDTFANVFADQENLQVRIVKAEVKKSPGMEKQVLGLKPKDPVIMVERIILHQNEPFTLHVSFTTFDPTSPTVEAMLDTVVLTGLIFQEGYSNFKRGSLHLSPALLESREADLLSLKQGTPVFKLDHLFYDFDNRATAFGWFLISHEKMPLISKVGIWDD